MLFFLTWSIDSMQSYLSTNQYWQINSKAYMKKTKDPEESEKYWSGSKLGKWYIYIWLGFKYFIRKHRNENSLQL